METIVYEVTLTVPAEREREMGEWLREHIREMLQLPYFETAHMWRVEDQAMTWVVQYHLPDRAQLTRYFDQHAALMRRAGLERFGNDLVASRRILTQPQTFSN